MKLKITMRNLTWKLLNPIDTYKFKIELIFYERKKVDVEPRAFFGFVWDELVGSDVHLQD